jgi:hypothetical protein
MSDTPCSSSGLLLDARLSHKHLTLPMLRDGSKEMDKTMLTIQF